MLLIIFVNTCLLRTRDAEPELEPEPEPELEPEPEPPEPTHFGRSRSRKRRNGLLGAGAVKTGAAPAPEGIQFWKNNGMLIAK